MKKNNAQKIRRQHTVPKTYLKHLCDGEKMVVFQIKENRYYSLKTDKISVVKDFYEFKDKNNNIISQNFNENCFKKIEDNYDCYYSLLEKCVCSGETPTEKEQVWWLGWAIIQLARTKNTIECGKELAKQCFNLQNTNISAENVAKTTIIPFYRMLNGEDLRETPFIKEILNRFNNVEFYFGYIKSDDMFFITSDNPVCFVGDCHTIILPISQKIILWIDERKNIRENIFEVSIEDFQKFMAIICYYASNDLYMAKKIEEDKIIEYRKLGGKIIGKPKDFLK